jgi:putative phosphoserine phosphatase / 1-acylglycerol-3-phosphate O-acyltransferase
MPAVASAGTPELRRALRAIKRAGRGPQVCAFFDYDGTVIGGYSASAFYEHRIRHREIGPIELARTLLARRRGIHSGEEFGSFLELSLAAWEGREEQELEELGEELFKHAIASRLHLEVWRLVQEHKAMGHTLVLASSATRFQVEPMARELGADVVLCTPLEVVDGRITGRVGGEPLWAEAKAHAVRALASERKLDLKAAFAYSNGTEDIEFLAAVGSPLAVQPDDGLRAEARRRGWPVLECASRGGRPGLRDVARTGAFYGAFAGAALTGAGAGLLNRSRSTMVEITGGVGADVGLSLAGVRVEVVRGDENLWATRPCVFVFNHQSKLDPIVLMKLLRSGFTGVAKAEAKNVPGFGQLFQLAGVAFVERGDSRQARRALEPAVAKLRDEGISLVIAPEGTRSATPRLGPFKKGPFHIAMQARVPMVPVVLRNVGEVMWRGAQVLSPGTVEVAVLPAVDTTRWSAETIDDHVAEVREMFLDTLGAWPGEDGDARGRQPSRRRPAARRKPVSAVAAARPRAKSKQSSARAGAARSAPGKVRGGREAARRREAGS